MNFMYFLYALPFAVVYGLLAEEFIFRGKKSKAKKPTQKPKIKEVIIEWINILGFIGLLFVYPVYMLIVNWKKEHTQEMFYAFLIEVLLAVAVDLFYIKRKKGE